MERVGRGLSGRLDQLVGQAVGLPATMAVFGPLLEAHPKLGATMQNLLPIEATEPVDQSNAVLFLASDESRYVTSLELTVDAGNTQF